MQLSTQFGFAFLCTPKCASTSIEKAIKNLCGVQFSGHRKLKHLNARTYAEKVRPIHQQLLPSIAIESFCLIRDPLDWMQSWYRYRSRRTLKNPNHPSHKHYTGNISYSEFIESYMAEGNRRPYAKIRTQYDFVRLDNGTVGVDHIFPMDRMDLVIDFIEAKTSRKIALPRLNRSPKKRSALTLDEKLEKQLCDYLANDIALYNLAKEQGHFTNSLHAGEFSPRPA